MTIEQKAIEMIKSYGRSEAIVKLKNSIFTLEASFDKNGFTSEDLRKVKEWKEILKTIQATP
jgi:hypothetical protein